ncbi:hypothetical protein DL89DRAFT_65488 [Linderina pennispora]|uniref:Uncharacterized protein n=1 Tax=Linderina pennispora TaxID=61395 RepID=A0A1Y1VZD1_9FUNG|nr:uncharacterized protein DL89DRAFT_65488 [Linderina pennispora]ORX66602.1 hypothetical protein DL89DRAFT_65488 [Linderina pennispora]
MSTLPRKTHSLHDCGRCGSRCSSRRGSRCRASGTRRRGRHRCRCRRGCHCRRASNKAVVADGDASDLRTHQHIVNQWVGHRVGHLHNHSLRVRRRNRGCMENLRQTAVDGWPWGVAEPGHGVVDYACKVVPVGRDRVQRILLRSGGEGECGEGEGRCELHDF